MVDRVVVGAEDGQPNPTGPNDAALAAKADKATAPQPDPQRPAWLPEKFQSPEALAAAYAELEKKQGAKPSVAENQDPTNPASKNEGEGGGDEAARKAAADAGLDFDALGREIAETGDISAEAREKLVAKGIPAEVIDQHVSGSKAQIALGVKAAYDAAGGEDAFKAMSEWAAKDASEEQLLTYNTLVQKGDPKSIEAAMKYLSGAYEAANGKPAARRVEGTANGAPSSDVYSSRQQVTADMKDPRYKNDPAFRAAVEAKVKRSSVL